jgi:hypothetical protein
MADVLVTCVASTAFAIVETGAVDASTSTPTAGDDVCVLLLAATLALALDAVDAAVDVAVASVLVTAVLAPAAATVIVAIHTHTHTHTHSPHSTSSARSSLLQRDRLSQCGLPTLCERGCADVLLCVHIRAHTHHACDEITRAHIKHNNADTRAVETHLKPLDARLIELRLRNDRRRHLCQTRTHTHTHTPLHVNTTYCCALMYLTCTHRSRAYRALTYLEQARDRPLVLALEVFGDQLRAQRHCQHSL